MCFSPYFATCCNKHSFSSAVATSVQVCFLQVVAQKNVTTSLPKAGPRVERTRISFEDETIPYNSLISVGDVLFLWSFYLVTLKDDITFMDGYTPYSIVGDDRPRYSLCWVTVKTNQNLFVR